MMAPTTMCREVDSATFMSYNPTGIDNPVKCSWLNDVCSEYEVDFLSIQEHFKSSKTIDKYFRDKFPAYHSVVVPGHRQPGQETGRAKAGLGQLSRKNIAVKKSRIASNHYRIQAQVLHLPSSNILWINSYFPTDPQLVGDYDDTELQSCLTEIESILSSTDYTDIVWGSDINWDMSRNTKFAQTVSSFLQRLDLVSLWSHHGGISHTFEQVFKNGRVSRSTVDHFLLSPRLLPLVVDCGVVHRGDNLSVHSPIWVKLRVGALPLRQKVQPSTSKKPSWSKASQDQEENFTVTLQTKLQSIQVPAHLHCLDVHCSDKTHLQEADSMVLDILCAIVETSYTTLPLYGGPGGGRGRRGFPTAFPGWSEAVKPYQAEARYWHDVWVSEGCPRGNWLHSLMVKKRAQYHYAIRRLRKKADLTRAELLFEASLKGDVHLLAEMKKIRCGGAGRPVDLPDAVAGAQGEDEIAGKFKIVYETLYNSADSEDEMSLLLQKVNMLVNNSSVVEAAKVTGTRVKQAACLLKPRKSDVSGGFTSDALLHAPDILFDHLATVFRSFLVHGSVSSYLLACCFLPLLKGSTKDPADTSSYRAIAGSSLILKLFEKVILLIWGHLLGSDSLQFGFKQDTSTTQCTWLVTEVVQYFLRQGSHPIVTLLDCKAAFDTCKFNILFEKLLNTGLPAIVVRTLMFSYQHQYAWVRWGNAKSDIFTIRNGTRQGSIASPVFWVIYCDLLIKELRQLGVGAHVAGRFMGASAYADDLVLIAPTRHAMQLMLGVCEDYARSNNILFSTHPNPSQSKTKCIFMVGNTRNLAKPAPLTLNGRELPWVETANHLGHMLHQNGTMGHDATIARAKFIHQSVETRQSFSFASPVEVVRALYVYCSSHYGSMLWDLSGEAACQYFNSWSTAVKLAWECPRSTRTYLLQQVLACGGTSARVDIMARYTRFFQGLCRSPCQEVSILANLLGRDRRSVTGRNISLVSTLSGCDGWSESSAKVKAALSEAETVDVRDEDHWRVQYLGTLLQQRQEWQYLGEVEELEKIQKLIDSLCIN